MKDSYRPVWTFCKKSGSLQKNCIAVQQQADTAYCVCREDVEITDLRATVCDCVETQNVIARCGTGT